MQQRNFWLFLFLSAAILAGWVLLQNQLGPLPQETEKQKLERLAREKAAKDKGTKTAAVPWEGLSTRARALSVAAGLVAPGLPDGFPAAAAGYLVAAGDEVGLLPREVVKEKPKEAEPKPTEPETPEKTFVLGNENFFIRAWLTNRGAGVTKLRLPKFREATWYGLPGYKREPNGDFVLDRGGDKVPEELDLIQEDTVMPSFLMYHYPDEQTDERPRAERGRPEASLGVMHWHVEKEPDPAAETQTAVFWANAPSPHEHLRIVKTYTLNARDYHIGLTLEIQDTRTGGGKGLPFRYQLAGAHGTPLEGAWYTHTHRNSMIGITDQSGYLERSMEQARRISFRGGGDRFPEGNRGDNAVQYAGVVTQYFASMITVDPEQSDDLSWRDILAYARPIVEAQEKVVRINSLPGKDHRANLTFMDEDGRVTVDVVVLPRALFDLIDRGLRAGTQGIASVYQADNGVWVATSFRDGNEPREMLDDISVRVVSEPVELEPGGTRTHKFILYHGPVKVRQLDLFRGDDAVGNDLVEKYAETLHLETLTDYPSWWGWRVTGISSLFITCTKIMHWLLNTLCWLFAFVVPFRGWVDGLAILFLTFLVRGALYPISRRQAIMSMKMQELAPEMKKIQEKYKNDIQVRQQKMMELYRQHNVNPIGGCLPLFLQLPIFMGLYYALQESIRFRLGEFLWIRNLAAPDMLLYWGSGVPWFTSIDNLGGVLYLGPYFNLLPILAVTVMIIMQQMMMPPAQDEQQEAQQKMMKFMMIFFGIMFYKVAAGLCIYFIASSVWGVAERKLLPKKQITPIAGGDGGTPVKPVAAPKGKGPKGKGPKGKGKPGKGQPEESPTLKKKVQDWWEDVLRQAKKK